MMRQIALLATIVVLLAGCSSGSSDVTTDTKAPETCVPNQRSCNGDVLESCAPSGYGFTVVGSCANGCLEGGSKGAYCAEACKPNSRTCSGNTLKVCWPDGSGYESTECSFGCNPTTLACYESCAPGTKRCKDDALQTCNDTGSGYQTESCQNGCNENNNACNPTCRPGDKKCDGGDLAVCNTNGDGFDTTPCANGCDGTSVSCFGELTADAGNDQVVVLGDEVTLSATASGGNSSAITCVWNDGNSDVSTDCSFKTTPSGSGNYTVTITDGSGNTATDKVFVKVNPVLAADAGSDQQVMLGDSVSLVGNATGGITPYSCVWLVDNQQVSNDCNYSFKPTKNVTLELKVTDKPGHSASDSVSIDVFPVLTVDAGSDVAIPKGGSTTLSATVGGGVPAVTCAWTDASNTAVSSDCSGVSVTPAVTTTYTVTVTDSKGHTASDTVTVAVADLLANAGADQYINKGKTTLSGTATTGVQPITCAWYKADDTTMQNELSGLNCSFELQVDETTEYKLVMTDSANNNSSDTVMVNVLMATAQASKTKILVGQSSELSASATGNKGSVTCVWSAPTGPPVATTCVASVSPASTTVYSVTVTDPDTGLTETASVTVEVFPVLSVDAGNDVNIITGNSTTLNGVVAGGVTPPAVGCVWNDGTSDISSSCTGVSVSPTSTTTYTVTATDSEGNSATDSVTVTVFGTFTVSVSSADQVLPGNSATLTGTVTGGLPSISCSWTNGTEFSTSCTTVQVTPSDTTTYTLSATDGTPETKTATVQVSVFRANAGSDTAIYNGSSATLSGSTSGSVGSLSYSWTGPSGSVVSTQQNPSVSPSVTTTYTLSVTDDFKNLVATDTVTVTVYGVLAVDAGQDDQVLSGGNSTLSATVTGGFPNVTCAWTASGSTVVFSTSCTTVGVTPTSTTDYTITVTDGNSTIKSDTVTVSVFSASAGDDKSIAVGQSATLTGSTSGSVGTLSWVWKDGSGATVSTQQTPSVSPTATTTYTLEVTDDFKGLVATDTVTVTVLSVDAGSDDQLVSGSVTLNGTVTGGVPTVSCKWNDGSSDVSTSCTSFQVSPTVTTTYTFSATDGDSNTHSDTVTVSVLKANAGSDATINSGESTTLSGSASGGVGTLSYSWADGTGTVVSTQQNPTLSPTATTTYTLSVTDDFKNLVATDTVTITVNVVESCSDNKKNGDETDIDCGGGTVWINEIHYDNTSGDVDEGVEIAGPAGTDLSGWTLIFYNGSNGTEYDRLALSGTIDDESNGVGALWFARSGLQNGAPDGIALVNKAGNVVQFLSYEGAFVATDGPADGMTSTDIGVTQTSSTPVGSSLQLTGSGTGYDDFSWQSPAPSSPGSLNSGQTISGRVCPPCQTLKSCNADSDCELNFCLNGSCSVCKYTVTFENTSPLDYGPMVTIDRIDFEADTSTFVFSPTPPFTSQYFMFLMLTPTVTGKMTFPFPITAFRFDVGDPTFVGFAELTTNSLMDTPVKPAFPYFPGPSSYGLTYPDGESSRWLGITLLTSPPDALGIDNLEITGLESCNPP